VLSQEIGGAKILAELKREHVLAFAAELGIKEKLAASTLDRLIDEIVPSSASMLKIAEEVRTHGEVRTLSEIHYNCIIELSDNLRKYPPIPTSSHPKV
jgi:hypothetical protein